MPSINTDFLNLLHDNYTKYPCFVETGTYNGETIFALEPFFQKLYTIEISELYHNRTKSRYIAPKPKIEFLLGDSSNVLETILPTIPVPVIFFLDGHWSSGDTGKGVKGCPLMEELTHINNLCKPNAIVIIDDVRLFGSDCDEKMWSGINKASVTGILANRIESMYYLDSTEAKNDRLVIHIAELD